MVRDGVANVVDRLRDRGFAPRKVGVDTWEARCPMHRSVDHALAITRNEFNHVILECRSTENCQYHSIIRALGFTNEHVYAETSDWLISRLSRVEVQRAFFQSTAAERPPMHPNPLPVEAGAMSGSDRPIEPEDTVFSASPLPEELGRGPDVSSGDNVERMNSVQVLSRLASNAQLFRSADGRFCAQVPVGDRLEIYRLESAAFRDWLIDGFLSDQPEPPSNWAIRRVVGMLEARARFNTDIPEVFVRVGQDGDGRDAPYFLDLGDPSGRAIAIRDQGWNIVDRPGVHFRRPDGLVSMPMPAHDGSIDLLRPYVNLTQPDFRLMIAWLTAALRPVGPYPILVLNGEMGSGKSTLAKVLRLLIDPQACPVLALPRSAHDLMATALNGWLLVYENISAIADSLSDCICQLAFGGGFASRTLFTNDERSVIYAQRPVLLVGIDDFVLRGDLRDRSVFLHLSAIPKTSRRIDRKYWAAFRADYPRILGGVLDAIVGGLRELPTVDLQELPRMADYAEWGEATSRGLGWGAGTFIASYDANRMEATELLLEDSTVAHVVLTLARKGIRWSGTPMQLYQALSKIVGNTDRARWPKTMHTFGAELRRIAPQLRLREISISFERQRGERIITLGCDGGNTTSRPSTDLPQS
jgi:energy-coupling factor transporter ATP-binding protein EcfA2